MRIYLDNCSTTKPREEVIEEMVYFLREEYGNPSSLHRMGLNTEKKVEKARLNIAKFLNVGDNEIYFTSGGTESNNIAIQGIVNKHKGLGKHIITTRIEHPSVLNIFKDYERKGFQVTYLEVGKDGIISLEQLNNSLRKDTILIAIMQVNNEIGSIQPIWEVNNIKRMSNSNALIHVDGVQAFGKVPVKLKDWRVDTFSFSSHKIYGPKGVGGLYVSKNLKLTPIIFGGNQERGLRSGTENVSGIIGFGKAVETLANNHDKETDQVRVIKSYFIKRLEAEISHIQINSPEIEDFSPYVLNVSFQYIKGEVLLHYLEDKGIFVSTSSACSSKSVEKSLVLTALGIPDGMAEGAIRFCFSYETTMKDIDYTMEILKESIQEIRQITMR